MNGDIDDIEEQLHLKERELNLDTKWKSTS
jgi:hypothetical protein